MYHVLVVNYHYVVLFGIKISQICKKLEKNHSKLFSIEYNQRDQSNQKFTTFHGHAAYLR